MRFFKNFSGFLVGGLLATTAAAELTKVVRTPKTFDGSTDSILSPEKRAMLQKRADSCVKAQQREGRRLRVRHAKDDMDMDTVESDDGSNVLMTLGLTTCIGIAVAGDLPEDVEGDDRFMAHVGADDEEGVVPEMKDRIISAKSNGLYNIRWQVVYPDPSTLDEWQEEQRADNQKAVQAITEAVGAGPNEVHEHDVKHGWDLMISKSKMIVALDGGEVEDDGTMEEEPEDRQEELEEEAEDTEGDEEDSEGEED